MKKKIIVILLLLSVVSYSRTVGEEEFVCPIDKQKFKAYVEYSGTSFGMRLDMKPIGPTPAPWLIPVCPKCGMPLFKDKFTEEEIKRYKSFLETDEYKKYKKTESSYFLIAKIKEFDKAPENVIGFTYIQASWQVENKINNDEDEDEDEDDKKINDKYKKYLQLALKHYKKYVENINSNKNWIKDTIKYHKISTKEIKDDTNLWITANIMVGEIERLLGNFDKSLAVFQKLREEDITKEVLLDIIEQEISLCNNKISSPQKIGADVPASDE